MTDTLPCLVCGKALKPATGDDQDFNQPYGGTMFSSHGNYGSTVFDPMSVGGNETLEINICDTCLKIGGTQNRVIFEIRQPQPSKYKTKLWNPNE